MPKTSSRALFITLEGADGTGKTTQSLRLAQRLRASGIPCLLTREPGGSAFAEQIRDLLLNPALPPRSTMAEALLFLAARADHVIQTIQPALEADQWVISDRFSDSTFVYQGTAGGIPQATLAALHELALGRLRPDFTLILDLPPEIALARMDARGAAAPTSDRFESRGGAYYEALRQGFHAIAAAEPERCALIDAHGSPDEVAGRIWAVTEARLARGGV